MTRITDKRESRDYSEEAGTICVEYLVIIEMAKLVVLLFCALLFSFVAAVAAVPGDFNKLNNFLFSGEYEFIDLTHPFDNQTIYWTNVTTFKFINKIEGNRPDGSW